MNKKRYKNTYYDAREINTLRELFYSSAELYAKRNAYLVKKRPGGKYIPIKYQEVINDMEALGTGFFALGLENSNIAVIGDNSYEWVLTYMATVSGVGVIVPLDKELPPNEIANLMARAHVKAVVYGKKQEKNVFEALELMPESEHVDHLIAMKEEHDERATDFAAVRLLGRNAMLEGDRRFLDAVTEPDKMSTLIFTSGTTGMSKGVMLSNRNLTSNIVMLSQFVRIQKDGIGLSVLPMHHCYEMTCHILTALYQGKCVAICEGLRHIQDNMAEAQATVMLGVPLVFETLHKRIMKKAEKSGQLEKLQKGIRLSKKLKLYNKPGVTKKMFSDVHEAFGGAMNLFIVGGAAGNPSIIEDFQAMGLTMIQGYGMTECSPIIALNRDRYSKPKAVGQALPGSEIKIINASDDGVGEIIVKSPSTMIGYYENEEATKETIIDGWLQTGDYGYFDEDGFLYISGRKKNVIVTKNGKNIFPEELESLLMDEDYIAEAVVYGAVDEGSDDTVIKAEIFPDYPVIKEELGDFSNEEIERLIKRLVSEVCDRIPSYKRIQRVEIRETEFEKTTTRKIKRYKAIEGKTGNNN